jgi:hypothetical protein
MREITVVLKTGHHFVIEVDDGTLNALQTALASGEEVTYLTKTGRLQIAGIIMFEDIVKMNEAKVFHVVYRTPEGLLMDFGHIVGSDADDLIAHLTPTVERDHPGARLHIVEEVRPLTGDHNEQLR